MLLVCNYQLQQFLLPLCVSVDKTKIKTWLRERTTIHLSLHQTRLQTPNLTSQTPEICENFKLGHRCNMIENVAFIIAHCTNKCLQLIPLRFLETILSHVEILFGAICHGKRDRIYYLLHSIIAGPGVLLEVGDIDTEIPILMRKYSCTSCTGTSFG